MGWKEIVGSVAPILGTALGGPFGAMAGKYLSGALLGNEDAGEDALEEAILNANPDMILKIKNSEQGFKVEMRRLGLQESQLEADDRKNARKLFTVDKNPQIILSGVFILGYFSILGFLFFSTNTIDDSQQTILNVLIGSLTVGVTNIMQFWFGSSSGSKDKKN